MKWTIGVIIGSVILLGVIIYFASISPKASNSETVTDKSNASLSSGTFELDQTSADLGSMEVNEEKSAIFKLKNTDTKPLSLRDFNTSCNCTDAVVKIGRKTSPTFNMTMHMSSGVAAWATELDPGETADIEVIYIPSKMPVYGAVSRYLEFKVGNEKQKLTVNAVVN